MRNFFTFGMGRDGGFGSSLIVGGGGAPEPEQMFRRVTKTFTVAELNALGAVTTGRISMGAEIPAGGIPLGVFARNLGNNVTSSGGTVTGLTVTAYVGAASNSFNPNALTTMQTANRRSTNYCAVGATDVDDFDVWSAWTPDIGFSVTGSGVTMANLTGGAAGIEVTVVYAHTTIKKLTLAITQAQLAAAGAVNAANFSMGTELPAGTFPICANFRTTNVLTGITGPLSAGIVVGSGITTNIGFARVVATTATPVGVFGTFGPGTQGDQNTFNYWGAWTPHIRIVSSSGNLSGVTGLAGGIECELYYASLDDVPNLTHTLTNAEIVALGAVTTGFVSLGQELPAGALPVMWFHKNNGNAGGGVSINLGIGKNGEGNLLDGDADTNTANARWARDINDRDGFTTDDVWSAWTPHICVRGNTGSTNLNQHTGAAAGFDVVFMYVEPSA